MKRFLPTFLLLITIWSYPFAQNNNGTIDQLEEIVQKTHIQMPMPDGTHLSTDVYLPIFSDSLSIPINIPGFGSHNLTIIHKGTQYIYYPTKNGAPNPNPYQLPLVLTRTTYDKSNGTGYLGMVAALLGYAGVLQDTRGVYDSEGVYFPLYSDSWEKAPYLNNQFPLDVFPTTNPSNVNQHADGVHTIEYLLDSLKRNFDINDDGIIDANDKICNGSIGMLGASALAIPEYQVSAARKINPNGPGLKGLINLIASNEHYNHTLYNNGLFREKLVKFWIDNQVDNFVDANIPIDNSPYNNIHSAADYGQNSIADVTDSLLNLLSEFKPDGQIASYYPNSAFRYAIDASKAPVNAQGMSDPNGPLSRYTNCDVPQYHFSGWYDIFASGQIDTWRHLRNELNAPSGNQNKQYLTIGPWAHTTIATQSTGDITYPNNVGDVLGFTVDINNFNINNLNLDINNVLNTEVLSFLRNTLNYNSYANVGEPLIRLPESNTYQDIGTSTLIRIPGEDYEMTHADLINFLGGQGGLPGINIKVYQAIEINLLFYTYYDTIQLADMTIDIPQLPVSVFDLIGGMSGPMAAFPALNDFSNRPAVQAYIIGPQNDGVSYNNSAGNYWMAQDSFPFFSGITWNKMFLHENGQLNFWAPDSAEARRTYTHDPDNPVFTIGGHNMLVDAPDGRNSQGQMNLANPAYAPYTLTHPGVIQFESDLLPDTVSIIGYPQAKIYASSLPQGANAGDPTNTDFVVRVIDVYPTGEEYYVIEGVVNARARLYTKSIVEGHEDVNAPFTNIASDSVYEFNFEMLPIGYTFGKDHKIKILISSSNHPKYQSCPNIPLEDNEFFRREVGENKSYTFQGQQYTARSADNSIYFEPNYPSYVTFPVFGEPMITCQASDSLWVDSISPFAAQLHWNQVAGVASYSLVLTDLSSGISDTTEVMGTHYTLQNLQQENDYSFYVISDCGMQLSPIQNFTTDEYCTAVDSLETVEITDSSAVLTWNAVDFAPGYTIYYGIQGDSLMETYVSDTFLLLENLTQDTTYEAFALTDCNNYSLYSDTLLFNTLATPQDTTDTLAIQTLNEGLIGIYPNPFSNQIIVTNNGSFIENLQVNLIEVNGKIVYQEKFIAIAPRQKIQLTTNDLQHGCYFIQIISNNHYFTLPLIKSE